MACTTSGQHAGLAPATEAAHAREVAPSHAQATRQRFLDMFARSYFPGRTGQLLVVPREGDFITRPDPTVLGSAFLEPLLHQLVMTPII
jgi:hypothetical protein